MFLQTKQDYQRRLFELLDPLLPHYSAGKAGLLLGYTGALHTPAVADMESFARVIWGLAPYFCGGGTSTEFEDIYVQGLTHGTDPSNPEYWGPVADYDQPLVEMAAIAFGLLLSPEKLWAPLSDKAQQDLAQWLNYANTREMQTSNWQFFNVLVNVAFKKLGCKEYNEERMKKSLDAINSYYVGNGWYKDGSSETFDYYGGFALHFYGLIYSAFMSEDDPTNSKAFQDRAVLFGSQFMYWFDEDGAGVPYGRSLTYRFAQVAFFSACVYAGVEPLALPVMKGIIDRNLQTWWQSHMLDFSGIITIGYEYPNLIMAEWYNGPGSPLWALKTFLLLALDDAHPYWAANAAAYPSVERIKPIPEANMILLHRNRNTILFPAGTFNMTVAVGHVEEKYAKFAYSSKYGFSVHKANDCLENFAPDNELVFEIGGWYFGRPKASSAELSGNTIVSRWSPFEGINVTTELTVGDNVYTTKHTIESTIACTAYSCGFAISMDAADYQTATGNDFATVTAGGGGCEVVGGPGLIIPCSANTNLLHPRTAIPATKHEVGVGTTEFRTSVMVFP